MQSRANSSDRPHPGLASPVNCFCSSHPLCCPISISSMCCDNLAAFKDCWTAPKSCYSDGWWGEGPWRAAVVGACMGCKELLLAWVLSVAGASLALTESAVLTVKQEHN